MRIFALCLTLVAVPLVALAQKAEKAAKIAGPAEETAMAIQFSGKELIEMANDFPEAKFDYKPTPEVRSFAEQLLHAAKGNQLFLDFISGKKPDFTDLPRANYKTKADIVKVLQQSIDDLAALAKKGGDKSLAKPVKIPFMPAPVSTQMALMIPSNHMAEHYGQLVVYYRLNKLVPPATKNQGKEAPQP
jgi:uncharacterized damage-inducible protein DinB